MRERLRPLLATFRGDQSRVGLVTLLVSGTAGLVVLAVVVLVGPAVLPLPPLSASWPPGFVLGASTAAVVCTLLARRRGRDQRAITLGAGAAAAVFAVASPGVALAVATLTPGAEEVLLGGLLDQERLLGLSVALAVPAFALGAVAGYALSPPSPPV